MRFRTVMQLAAIAVTLALMAADADAAPKFNAGSRGSRTFIAPPPTTTAPNSARPIERSMTQPAQPGASSQPAAAFAGGPAFRDVLPNRPQMNFGSLGRSAPFAGAAPIEIRPADFDAFERSLSEIQLAYGAEDLNALRLRMTPEMLSYYSEELAKNASRGVVNP
jgi:predicted lipid-binding transport protein (Tim44 family)